MAHLSPGANTEPWHMALLEAQVPFIHSGKVRNTYQLDRCVLLQVATDRLSIFDFVLPATIPGKGEILTALTIHWLTTVLFESDHHLLSSGSNVRFNLPSVVSKNSDLQKRALVVQALEMAPVECIARGYLTGSGWKSYNKDHTVCGDHLLPEGLFDGARLSDPIFTPSTKAEAGHDENISFEQLVALVGHDVAERLRKQSLDTFRRGAEYALERGIIIADTKLEFSIDGMLGDEVLTPDSSRFWDLHEWEQSSANRKSPSSYDKEVVRTWGKTVDTPWGKGIQNLDPINIEHLAFVDSLQVPPAVIEETLMRYHQIFVRLTGQTLKDFQRDVMKIAA